MKVVQIGTNDGDDDVRKFCLKEKPDFILLVEPFTVHNDKIRSNYEDIIDRIHLENIAIHPTSNLDSLELFYADRDGIPNTGSSKFEVTSMVAQHLMNHGYSNSELKTFNVKAMTLNSLLDKYNLTTIDYLFLDIEGIDFEVLTSIDFNRYDIKHLQIEHIHLDRDELESFMSGHGYHKLPALIDTRNFDTLFKKN